MDGRHGGRWNNASRLRLGQSNNSVTTLLFDKLKNRHGCRFALAAKDGGGIKQAACGLAVK
jgi:hypothetical protein